MNQKTAMLGIAFILLLIPFASAAADVQFLSSQSSATVTSDGRINTFIKLKNFGNTAAPNFLVELQPMFSSQSIYPSPQDTCNPAYPNNVHRWVYSLQPGEIITLNLVTTPMASGIYSLRLISTNSCCVGPTGNPNCAAVPPFNWKLDWQSIRVTSAVQVQCGNGKCESGENYLNCASDCTSWCGDGICNSAGGETSSWCLDCTGTSTSTTTTQTCGNGIREGTETCDTISRSCTTSTGSSGTQACNSACNGWNSCVSGTTPSSAPKIVKNGNIQITPTPFSECTDWNSNSPGYGCVAATDMIRVDVPIKNIGGDMIVPWILELQSNRVGTNLMAVLSKQSVCDASTPQNVHMSFKLNSGESTVITLTSKVIILSDPPLHDRFFIDLLMLSGCCSSAGGCNTVDAPFGWGETVGQVDLKAQPQPNVTRITCGDGICDYSVLGIENEYTCPKDCTHSICGDGYCNPASESSWCTDCTGTTTSITIGGKCETGWEPDPTYNLCCPVGKPYNPQTQLCGSVSGNTSKSLSLPFKDWKEAPYTTRLKARCNDVNDCNAYVDPSDETKKYNLKCIDTQEIRDQLTQDAVQYCKDNPTVKGSIIGILKGGITGCVAGGTVGAVAGLAGAGVGAVPGAIGGCIIGAAALGTIGSGTTYFGAIDCRTEAASLVGPQGACIAQSRGFGALSEDYTLFGMTFPLWAWILVGVIALMVFMTLMQGFKK